MTYLTKHFTEEEMLRSDYATRKGIAAQFNPIAEVIGNLGELCANVLEPLRDKLNENLAAGKPDMGIHISSGYRCLEVNVGIGGVANSQHILGMAADTEVNSMTVEEWYQFIKKANIKFDQLIYEFGAWVHVSYNSKGAQRGECLRYTKDGKNTVKTLDGYVTFS